MRSLLRGATVNNHITWRQLKIQFKLILHSKMTGVLSTFSQLMKNVQLFGELAELFKMPCSFT